jgi:hypothetical protein
VIPNHIGLRRQEHRVEGLHKEEGQNVGQAWFSMRSLGKREEQSWSR